MFKTSMFFDQVFSSAVLANTVLAVTDPFNANPPGMAPLLIGLAATTMGLCFGANAGYDILLRLINIINLTLVEQSTQHEILLLVFLHLSYTVRSHSPELKEQTVKILCGYHYSDH